MLKKTNKILNIFAKKPWIKYNFKDIKKLSGNKSESYVYNTLKNFVKQNILKQENIGNIIIYSITDSSKAITHLAIAFEYESWKKNNIPYKDIENIISKLPTNFFTLIITGSYAKNKQTKESDIDLVILCKEEKRKIYAELKQICEMNIPQIHLYVFTEKEFLEMLINKKQNYGKEIVKNNLILSGGETYYRIIKRAIEYGFTG